ncbi:hypothetical protein M0R04_08890 [Candidatus Dojkabacteria bacterium]|jgi:hypothetical protein|nr:hypothetical protein [Candidatus Dojkabacteria bacterium]
MINKNFYLVTSLVLIVILFSVCIISATIPRVVIPLPLTSQIIIINGSAIGNCPAGYAIQNLTGSSTQCVLMPTSFNSSNPPNIFNQILNTTSDVIFHNLTLTGNIFISGNVSVKRPYWSGYDNSTQNFLNTANVQVVNISNNNDYDAWMVSIVNRQNITFQQTGDYLITFIPEFTLTTGTNKVITFWIRKNGVDVPWSNTRISLQTSSAYIASSITYHVDITNPVTDNIQIMWWSDSTDTQIVSLTGLTSPTRPSIPGVLIDIQKTSEITP